MYGTSTELKRQVRARHTKRGSLMAAKPIVLNSGMNIKIKLTQIAGQPGEHRRAKAKNGTTAKTEVATEIIRPAASQSGIR